MRDDENDDDDQKQGSYVRTMSQKQVSGDQDIQSMKNFAMSEADRPSQMSQTHFTSENQHMSPFFNKNQKLDELDILNPISDMKSNAKNSDNSRNSQGDLENLV